MSNNRPWGSAHSSFKIVLLSRLSVEGVQAGAGETLVVLIDEGACFNIPVHCSRTFVVDFYFFIELWVDGIQRQSIIQHRHYFRGYLAQW